MSQLAMGQKAGVELVKSAPSDRINARGRFKVEHWRNGKRINEYQFPNGIVNQGKNELLNVMFHSTAAITSWFVGLLDSISYTALAATDDYQDINQVANGWKEFTAYTDNLNGGNATTRPAWAVGAASAQSVTNAAPSVFDITSAGTVKGLFLVGGISAAQTKNDHAANGILWATALFTSGDVTVAAGDQLKVTYTVSA